METYTLRDDGGLDLDMEKSYYVSNIDRCRSCSGTGKSPEGEACRLCAGSGLVRVAKEILVKIEAYDPRG